jgi:hypothetical protein
MDLCESMLNPGPGTPKLSVHTDDAMLQVIGFLEACVPRMIELVEAASVSGVLSETVFEEVLQANDRLQKVLEDVETAALTETPATTTAAKANMTPDDVMAQFDDLFLGSEEGAPTEAPPAGGGKTTGETNDDFQSDDAKQPAVQPSSSVDEFDAFFSERQGS